MRSGKAVIKVMWCLFGLQVAKVTALPSNLESMVVSRMKMEDLETSATGYSYHQQHGVPASYVHYNNQGRRHYYNAPAPVSYVASAVGPDAVAAPLAYGSPKAVLQVEPVPVQYVEQVPENYEGGLPAGYVVPLLPERREPLAPYYTVPVKVEQVPEKIEIVDDDKEEDDEQDEDDDEDDDGDDDEDDDDEDTPEHRDFDIYNKSFGHGFEEPAKTVASFEKGEGAAHEAEEHSAHGDKGDKAYKKYHGFDNGEKAERESENHKGHHSEDAGHKKYHSDTAGHYGRHAEGSKGEDGASYGAAKSHKKGHKTTGFHNVYHKDEYKKDTDFYDDAHKSGGFEKHGASGSHHASAEGEFKKGGHHDSAYAENEAGKDGKFEKGHDNQESKGHKAAEGKETYHENHADYAANGAASGGKAHGYSKRHHQPGEYSS